VQLVLASTSRYRRELLDRLRIPYRAVSPAFDEESARDPHLPAEKLAIHLARGKAESLIPQFPDAVILASDQICALGARHLGKPGDSTRAAAQLRQLSGKSHQLVTAVCLYRTDRHGKLERQEHIDVTQLRMRSLGMDEINRYVETDVPYDCAGSYKLESLGVSLFDRVESADQTAIIGLPLMAVADMLRAWGWRIP
jgi:septum formation protein